MSYFLDVMMANSIVCSTVGLTSITTTLFVPSMNTSELPTDQVTIATVYNDKCSLVKLGNPFCIYTFSRYLLA